MDHRRLRVAAAVVALAYVGVQAFQEYVYRTLPTPSTPVEELVAGAAPLHLARSTLMLFAMFALIFFYGALCVLRMRARPVLAAFTFLAFFLFGILEIGLRSVELFWTQIELPAAWASTHAPAILDKVATFQQVQGALYFPLMLSTLIGTIGLWFLFEARVVRVVLVINGLRIVGRMLTAYAGWSVFPSAAYELAYFPLVLAFYGPLAYWLLRGEGVCPGPSCDANRPSR